MIFRHQNQIIRASIHEIGGLTLYKISVFFIVLISSVLDYVQDLVV